MARSRPRLLAPLSGPALDGEGTLSGRREHLLGLEHLRDRIGADGASMGRFDPDGTSAVVVSSAGENPVDVAAGTRRELRDYLAPAVVWRPGRPAQVDEDAWSSVSDPVADALREAGVRPLAASPIIVEGRL